MRIAILCALIALSWSWQSTVALAWLGAAAEPAPPPREVDPDPRTRARLEEQRRDMDPVLRGLARREIHAGDAVEQLIKDNPHYEVYRRGDYVVLCYDATFHGGTHVMAKGGKLVGAWTISCVFHDTFFDTMTDEVREAGWEAFQEEFQKSIDFKSTLPSVVGCPAGMAVLMRPTPQLK